MNSLKRSFAAAAPAPVARKDNKVVDHYHGVAVPDPYRHLENLDAPETLAWAAAQQQRFEDFIAGYDRSAAKAFLTSVWDYPKETMPSRYGNKYFDYYNPGLAAQYVLRVRDSQNGQPRVLIDPNTLSADGTVALNGTTITGDGKLVAYKLSESGSDAETIKIRDVETGQDLPDTIENCRFTSICWDQDYKGFHYSYPAQGAEKRFVLKHHTLGDDPANDPVAFGLPGIEDSFVSLSRPRNGSHEWVYTGVGTSPDNGLYVRKSGSNDTFAKVFETGFADLAILGEFDGYVYMTTNHSAPRSKLVRFKLDAPEPQNWETVIPEHDEDLLQYVFHHKGKLYVGYSHDCADQVKIFDINGQAQGAIPLPLQSVVSIGRIREEDDTFLLDISNFQQPGSIYEYDTGTGTLELFRPTAAKADLNDCIVERIYATSKDGTKVPMTVIRRPDVDLDGTAAVKLYGYGGFNVSLEPDFSFGILNWVRSGGIYVQANLRGGGEFGSEWYDQGRLDKKQNVFDDFIACAEHLVARNYTSPERLTISGGSNGGLLTLACMLQRPDLYGAVISSVPVTDMLRFHKHTYGAAWKSDYGDPEKNPQDFAASMAYSPLHNVKAGQKYPPCLVLTADHDDRVVPSHSYKFVATAQELAHPDSIIMLRVEQKAGHGAGKPTEKIIDEMLDAQAFITQAIGPINQMVYKQALQQLGPQRHTPTPNGPV